MSHQSIGTCSDAASRAPTAASSPTTIGPSSLRSRSADWIASSTRVSPSHRLRSAASAAAAAGGATGRTSPLSPTRSALTIAAAFPAAAAASSSSSSSSSAAAAFFGRRPRPPPAPLAGVMWWRRKRMTTGRSATSADGTWSVTVVHTSASARGSSTSEPSASRTGAVNAVSSSITSVRTSTARLCCASCTRSGTMATSSRLSGGSTTWSISPTASSSASPSTTRSSQRNCESSSFGSGIPPCALSGSSSACSAGSISRSAFATPACSGSTWSSSRTRLSFTASAPNPAARPPAGACIGTSDARSASGSAHASASAPTSSSAAPSPSSALFTCCRNANESASASPCGVDVTPASSSKPWGTAGPAGAAGADFETFAAGASEAFCAFAERLDPARLGIFLRARAGSTRKSLCAG